MLVALLMTGLVCIQRMEDGGPVNIYPVFVDVDGIYDWKDSPASDARSFKFKGGQEICFPLAPGRHRIGARWPQFDWNWSDHGASGDSFLAAPPRDFLVREGQTARLEICSTRNAQDIPAWDVRKPGSNCPK